MAVRALFCIIGLMVAAWAGVAQADPAQVQSDILFVTQVPFPADGNNVTATSGNHRASITTAPRGGDLYIRYQDGTLKNLTTAAGFGISGLQGANAIAVRDPCVHWNGDKAIFSMVVGAPEQFEFGVYNWQLYEISGLGLNDTPVITRIPNQPSGYNNIMPAYGSDDRIIFVSDRPRDGSSHLYPQLDEALSFEANSGLWKLDPVGGSLTLLDHAPSGVFKPFIDSFGRILLTRWDHLQRDQLGDDTTSSGAFNYADEAIQGARLRSRQELFPEPRSSQQKIANLNLHTFNQFFPWQINQDGSDLETLNHAGRHELRSSARRSFTNNDDLEDLTVAPAAVNQQRIVNLFQMREDPQNSGMLFGIDAPQFNSHGAGQLISLLAPPTLSADQFVVNYLTSRSTHAVTDSPPADHSGLYRDPLPLANGAVIASHTLYTGMDRNDGTREAPLSRYDFRLKVIAPPTAGQAWLAQDALTAGISKQVSYYDPAVLVSYSGPLWELQPVEVRPRQRPPLTHATLESPEAQAFQNAAVDVAAFQNYLSLNNLAVIVSRNVTTRDAADHQQPFNLRVADTNTATTGSLGALYDVKYLQIYQGDLLRGYGGREAPLPGRRVIAQPLHEPNLNNPLVADGPAGSVAIAPDGSVAAFVPAQRALSWQLTDPSRRAVVRERYWLTFQPGEIRVCTSCHGLNSVDQAGHTKPENTPEALTLLLDHWKNGVAADALFNVALTLPSGQRPKANIFYSNKRARIRIGGLNAAAASKAVDILLKAGRFECEAPIAHLVTAADGQAVLAGVIPKLVGNRVPRSVQLNFSLMYNQTIAATSKLHIRASPQQLLRRKLTQRQARRLCRDFEQFQSEQPS